MSAWLMPSLGLPVAMSTGRLLVLTLSGASHHLSGAVIVAAGSAVTLMMGCAALLSLRRRRVSRRGSTS